LILFDLSTLGTLTIGSFIERKNRFLATAIVHGKVSKVHVADTGRLEEILTPKRELLLLENPPNLKTDYTLIAARMEEGWVLVNTRLHRPIAQKAIEKGVLGFIPRHIRAEVPFGKSRFDYSVDEAFVELKGCSLVKNGICLFPNAPTIRGVKHLQELMEAKERGFGAYILIMAVRPCSCFMPHPTRDPLFKETFVEALRRGVLFRGFFIRIDEKFRVLYAGELHLCPAVQNRLTTTKL